MTPFERDMVRVLCGAGDEVIARRERAIEVFVEEYKRAWAHARLEVLRDEIAHLRKELALLREQHENRRAAAARR